MSVAVADFRFSSYGPEGFARWVLQHRVTGVAVSTSQSGWRDAVDVFVAWRLDVVVWCDPDADVELLAGVPSQVKLVVPPVLGDVRHPNVSVVWTDSDAEVSHAPVSGSVVVTPELRSAPLCVDVLWVDEMSRSSNELDLLIDWWEPEMVVFSWKLDASDLRRLRRVRGVE